jgi:glycogen(starch) synthase
MGRRLRIALVSQEYPPDTAKGGIGTQTFLKARGLSALGHEVHVITRAADDRRSEQRRDGVHVTRLPGFSARAHVYEPAVDWLTWSAEVAAGVAALHDRSRLDVVDFPEWAAEGYVHLLNRTEWNHVPTVVHLHGPLIMLAHTIGWPEADSHLYRVGVEMEHTCVRLADCVFSSSECSADWCARHYGLDRDSIPVLHAGVDTAHFAPRNGPKSERPTIIFAGKVVWNKGVRELVEAACELAGEVPDLRLRLLGRAPKEVAAALNARASDRGLPRLLEFVDFVPHEALPDHLSRAHVFAGPSRYEGGPGFVYLESMACGIPVIACAGSGAAEVVRPGENGLLVPPGDVAALTEALRQLITDPGAAAAMGRRARDYVLREADARVCLPRLESFYAEVADRYGLRTEKN